jgi:hypothetical protein
MRRRFGVETLLLLCASCAGPGVGWRPDLDDFARLQGAGPVVDRGGGKPRYWIELGSFELSASAPKFELQRELSGLPKAHYTVALESPSESTDPKLSDVLDLRIEVVSAAASDVPAQTWSARTRDHQRDLIHTRSLTCDFHYLLDATSMGIESGRCTVEVRGTSRTHLAAPRFVRVYLAGGGVFY